MRRYKDLFMSVEEAKFVKRLGLDTRDAHFAWCYQNCDHDISIDEYGEGVKYVGTFTESYSLEFLSDNAPLHSDVVIPTYTLQEMIEKLPRKIYPHGIECTLNLSLEKGFVAYELKEKGKYEMYDSFSDYRNGIMGAVTHMFVILVELSEIR